MNKTWVAVLTLLITLALINTDIVLKERQLRTGQRLILSLVPVDPRSLMQGDYMDLRYAMSADIQAALADNNLQEGLAVVQVNNKQQGQFLRLHHEGDDLASDEMLLYFRVRDARVKIASNAFFFEEGAGAEYAQAKYALLRVGNRHQPLLVQLLDENLQAIKASATARQ